jgi:hypothetical protein
MHAEKMLVPHHVETSMLRICHHPKIFRPVIETVAIDVVNV